MSTRGDLSTYAALKDAANSLHYWEDARRQYADEWDKAAQKLHHADARIVDYSAKLRTALLELNFATETTEATP